MAAVGRCRGAGRRDPRGGHSALRRRRPTSPQRLPCPGVDPHRRPRLATHLLHRVELCRRGARVRRRRRRDRLRQRRRDGLRQRAGGGAPRGRARDGRPASADGRADAAAERTRGRPCARRWQTCRSGPPSAPWCTPSSSTPTRPHRRTTATCGPSCSSTCTASWCAGRCGSTPTSSPTRWSRSATPRSGRSPASAPCARSVSATGCASSTSSCPSPAVTGATTTGCRASLADIGPLLRRHLARGRPAAALRRRGRGPRSRGTAAARLPHRLGRRRAARRRPLRHRRLQDQLAGPPTRAGTTAVPGQIPCPCELAPLPAGRARRGDAALQLPPPGAAVRRGAAPVPALAPARLRPGDPPRRGDVPLPAGHVRARHPSGRRAALRGVRLAATGGAGGGALRPARRRSRDTTRWRRAHERGGRTGRPRG